MKIAEAQYKCEVCGNITTKPYEMQILIYPPDSNHIAHIRRSKFHDICEECVGPGTVGTFVNWFKKLWRKK